MKIQIDLPDLTSLAGQPFLKAYSKAVKECYEKYQEGINFLINNLTESQKQTLVADRETVMKITSLAFQNPISENDAVSAEMELRQDQFLKMVKESPKYKAGDKVVPKFAFFEGKDQSNNFMVVENVTESKETEIQHVFIEGLSRSYFHTDFLPFEK